MSLTRMTVKYKENIMIAKKYLVALDEKQLGVTKKPSQLYMFSKDIYNKMYKNNYFISI